MGQLLLPLGGDAAANGFVVSAGGSTVLGFHFYGGSVPAGCGTLLNIDGYTGTLTTLSGIVFSDTSGTAISVSYEPYVPPCVDGVLEDLGNMPCATAFGLGASCATGLFGLDGPYISAACPATCGLCGSGPACGDGIVDAGEECDDSNQDNSDACLDSCQNAVCGDGFTQSGVEECDDNNNDNGDGCSSSCQSECGNGNVDGGEQCDDGDTANGDGCDSSCSQEAGWFCSQDWTGSQYVSICDNVCGNGVQDSMFVNDEYGNSYHNQESCDDSNSADDDGCSSNCYLEWQASCEPNNNMGHLFPSNCEPAGASYCGDGIINNHEQCDDGNNDWADGCGGSCMVEIHSQYTCVGSPSVCTQTCGTSSPGVIDNDQEQCDDGNLDWGDACTPHCELPNGYILDGSNNAVLASSAEMEAIVSSGVIALDGLNRAVGTVNCADGNSNSDDGCGSEGWWGARHICMNDYSSVPVTTCTPGCPGNEGVYGYCSCDGGATGGADCNVQNGGPLTNNGLDGFCWSNTFGDGLPDDNLECAWTWMASQQDFENNQGSQGNGGMNCNGGTVTVGGDNWCECPAASPNWATCDIMTGNLDQYGDGECDYDNGGACIYFDDDDNDGPDFIVTFSHVDVTGCDGGAADNTKIGTEKCDDGQNGPISDFSDILDGCYNCGIPVVMDAYIPGTCSDPQHGNEDDCLEVCSSGTCCDGSGFSSTSDNYWECGYNDGSWNADNTFTPFCDHDLSTTGVASCDAGENKFNCPEDCETGQIDFNFWSFEGDLMFKLSDTTIPGLMVLADGIAIDAVSAENSRHNSVVTDFKSDDWYCADELTDCTDDDFVCMGECSGEPAGTTVCTSDQECSGTCVGVIGDGSCQRLDLEIAHHLQIYTRDNVYIWDDAGFDDYSGEVVNFGGGNWDEMYTFEDIRDNSTPSLDACSVTLGPCNVDADCPSMPSPMPAQTCDTFQSSYDVASGIASVVVFGTGGSNNTNNTGVCGDGIVNNPNSFGFYEECDDGNNVDGDGCSSTCTIEGSAAVPEFSDYAIALLLLTVVGGFVAIRRKQY